MAAVFIIKTQQVRRLNIKYTTWMPFYNKKHNILARHLNIKNITRLSFKI